MWVIVVHRDHIRLGPCEPLHDKSISVNGKTLKETEMFFLAWATEMGIDYPEKLLIYKQGRVGSLWFTLLTY